jgi:hypothetical protein
VPLKRTWIVARSEAPFGSEKTKLNRELAPEPLEGLTDTTVGGRLSRDTKALYGVGGAVSATPGVVGKSMDPVKPVMTGSPVEVRVIPMHRSSPEPPR